MVCKAKTYLKDYQAPTHSITEIFLDFDLGKESVRVESILKIEPSSSDNKLLELQGEELCLKEVCLNGLKVCTLIVLALNSVIILII